MRIIYYTLILVFLLPSCLVAQMIVIDPDASSMSVEEMVEDYFQYENFELLDVSYTGDHRAFGRFHSGQEAVGFSDGLIITTGRAQTNSTGIGADAVRDSFANVNYNYMAFSYDSDVRDIPPMADTIQNLALLNMTVLTKTDTIYLDYLFGSEDYQDYNCVEGDDYFGIIVSGPGYEGDYRRNGELISTVPTADSLPIRVSTVHPTIDTCIAQNEVYYQENEFGTQPVYSGLTQTFTHALAVEKGQVYQIKFLIADGQFPSKDAGLFFNLRSCDTPICRLPVPETETFMEGCSDSLMTLDFSEFASILPLNYEIVGSAIPGLDYPTPPDLSGTITIDNPLISLDLNPFQDNITEPLETVILRLSDTTGAQKDYFWTLSDDTENWSLNRNEICDNTGNGTIRSLALYVENPINSPTYDFDFTFNQATQFPLQAFTFELSDIPFDYLSSPFQINSICINSGPSSLIGLDLTLVAPNGKQTKLISTGLGGNRLDSCCFSPDANLRIGWSGGYSTNEQRPYYGTWQPSDLWDGLAGGQVNGIWSLLADRTDFYLKDISISFREAAMPHGAFLWSDGHEGNFRLADENDAQDNISVIFQDDNCNWIDSLHYNTNENSSLSIVYDVCSGDTLWVNGIPFSDDENNNNQRGSVFFENGAYNGCDSIIYVNYNPIYTPMFFHYYSLPTGVDLVLQDTTFTEYGQHQLDYISTIGCDSILFVNFLPPPSLSDSSINETLVQHTYNSCDTFTDVCIPTGYYGYTNDYNYIINGDTIGQSSIFPRCGSRTVTCYSYPGIENVAFRRMNMQEIDINNADEWIYFEDLPTWAHALNYTQGYDNEWFVYIDSSKLCTFNSIGPDFTIEVRDNSDGEWDFRTVSDSPDEIPNGILLPFPRGENTLIINKENAPDDTVFVNINRELPETQTENFSITLLENQSFLWELNDSELCGEITSAQFCNSPDGGLADININAENGSLLIFPYSIGEQEICVSFCDSIGLCDTLNLSLNIIDDGISSAQMEELMELNIYPNPSSGLINIQVNSACKIEQVEIYSLLGNKISTHISDSNNLKINTSEMLQAVYYLKIKTNIGVVMPKITIVR